MLSNPPFPKPPQSAFVPGQRSLSNLLTVPTVLIALTMVALAQRKEQVRKETAMRCDEKYCPPTYQIHVDRPVNTLLKDQSGGAGLRVSGDDGTHSKHPPTPLWTLANAYRKTKMDYLQEQATSSGVRLVAHAIP